MRKIAKLKRSRALHTTLGTVTHQKMPILGLDAETIGTLRAAVLKCGDEPTSDQKKFCDQDPNAPVTLGLHVLQAIAGAGKTATMARLAAMLLMNPDVQELVVMSSLRTSASSALAAIKNVLELSGLIEYCDMPKNGVRTVHSIALQHQREAGAPHKIKQAKPFVRKVLITLLLPGRLEDLGFADVAEAWRQITDTSNMSKVEAAARKDLVTSIKNSQESTEERVSEFVRRKYCFDGEPLLKTMGFDFEHDQADAKKHTTYPQFEHVLENMDRLRTEVLNRGVDVANLDDLYRTIISETERIMNEAECVDFTQLIRRFAKAYHPIVGNRGVLIVDEAQDLTQAQLQIVQTTLEKSNLVFIVGDKSQGICTFAGASYDPIADAIEYAENAFHPVHRYGLFHNFRSTAPIIKASECILPESERLCRDGVTGLQHQECFAEPIYRSFPHQNLEDDWLGTHIVALIRHKNVDPGTIAVVRYTNFSYGDRLVQFLMRNETKIRILGLSSNGSLFSEKLCCALLVAMGTDDLTEEEEAISTLQIAMRLFGHGNSSLSCTPKTQDLISDLAALHACQPEDVLLNFGNELVDKHNQSETADSSKKRNKDGHTLATQNVVKAVTVFKKCMLKIRNVLSKLHNDPTLTAFGSMLNDELSDKAVGLPTVVDYKPKHPLGKFVRSILSEMAARIDDKHAADINLILERFDIAVDEGAEIASVIQDTAMTHLDMINNKAEDSSVILSTGHKFKGRQRDRVFVSRMGTSFDWIKVDPVKLAVRAAMLTPSATADAKKGVYDAEVESANLERCHLGHVMLSRPRYELHVSGCQGGRTEDAMKGAGFPVLRL